MSVGRLWHRELVSDRGDKSRYLHHFITAGARIGANAGSDTVVDRLLHLPAEVAHRQQESYWQTPAWLWVWRKTQWSWVRTSVGIRGRASPMGGAYSGISGRRTIAGPRMVRVNLPVTCWPRWGCVDHATLKPGFVVRLAVHTGWKAGISQL